MNECSRPAGSAPDKTPGWPGLYPDQRLAASAGAGWHDFADTDPAILAALFFELVDDPHRLLMVLDDGLRVRHANRTFQRLCGLPPCQYRGQRIDALWQVECLQAEWPDCLRSGGRDGERDGLEIDYRGAAGVTHTVRLRVVEQREVSDGSPQIIILGEDVTRQRCAEAQVQAYQSRLRKMAVDLERTAGRERRQIAVDLHDRIGQTLAAIQLKLRALSNELPAGGVQDTLETLNELVEQAAGDTRSLTSELSPPVLHEVGLGAALEWLADEFRRLHDMEVAVDAEWYGDELDEDVRGALFRSTRELLYNVVKHAAASSVEVRLQRTPDGDRIEVRDDGCGFDPSILREHATGSLGLFSVAERMEALGGRLDITSTPGEGTCCMLAVPLAAALG